MRPTTAPKTKNTATGGATNFRRSWPPGKNVLKPLRRPKAELEAEARAKQEQEEAQRQAKSERNGKPKQSKRKSQRKDPKPKDKDQRNFTGPESRIMRNSDEAFIQAYNAQATVDAETQIIVAVDLAYPEDRQTIRRQTKKSPPPSRREHPTSHISPRTSS